MYCHGRFNGDDLILLYLPVDTRSASDLENQIAGSQLQLQTRDHRNLSGFDKGKMKSKTNSAGVTFLLEDKSKSLILHSNSKNNYVFDANTKEVTKEEEQNIKWERAVLFATRASEQDKINLGC